MNYPEHFITAGKGVADFNHMIPAAYIRRTFELKMVPEETELMITGLGFYRVWVNGTEITKSILAPYISNPDHRIYYDRYEVGDILRDGENVIGVLLGNGMMDCFGGYIWDFDKALFRGESCTAFWLKDEMTGETLAESDENCLCHDSPLLFNDLRCGEYYDARREIPGWNLPGDGAAKKEETGWTKAVNIQRPRGVLSLCKASPIRVYSERKAAWISPYENGWLYDFGVNSAGVCRLRIHGEAGQEIAMFHGELYENGKLYQDNINFAERKHPNCEKVQVNRFICSGGEDCWQPYFAYDGFRYVYVQGITEEQAVPELLTFLEMSGDFADDGTFSCSDPVANGIEEIIRRSDRANFLWFPTDCPHREKNGWTGDAAASARQFLLNFSSADSLKEWMRNITASQAADGSIPGIVPTGGWGFEWGNGPAWDHVLVEIPYELYLLKGDLECAKESAASIVRYLQHISTRRDSRGLIAIGLGDWCESNGTTKAEWSQAPLIVTDSIITMLFCRKAAVLLNQLGQKEAAGHAAELEKAFRNSVRRYLVDFGTMTVEGRSQAGQALALHAGVFERGEEPAAFARLLDFIHEYDDHMHAGMIGLRVLFRVLASHGQTELAWKMITREDFPSYGNLIARGLTALPEMWTEEEHVTYSLNHHFFGDISAWFIEYVTGIRINPFGNNAKEIRIAPAFIRSLTHAAGKVMTVCGPVEACWKRDGEADVRMELTVPEGISGTIVLPEGYRFESSGAAVAAGSGSYRIARQ